MQIFEAALLIISLTWKQRRCHLIGEWKINCVISRGMFSSVQFSHSIMSDSLRPHESQHARPPCLSPTPGVYPNSCPWNRWCHPAISSSVVPFSSCPQFLLASGSFPMSQLFAWGGQSIGVSASASGEYYSALKRNELQSHGGILNAYY